MNRLQKFHKPFLFISAAIIFHAVYIIMTAGNGVDWGVLRYFSVLSNLLLVVAFILRGVRFRQDDTYGLSFVAYIAVLVTCGVYNFALVPFDGANPFWVGWGNFVTHFLSITLVVVHYFIFEKKGRFRPKHVTLAVLFPAAYWLVFMFVGPFFNFVPYFFMDLEALSLVQVLMWFAGLVVVFGIVAWLLERFVDSGLDGEVWKVYLMGFVTMITFGILSVVLIVVFVIGFAVSTSRPREVPEHLQILILEQGVDIPEEGLRVEVGTSLYIHMRGNFVFFRHHTHDYILVDVSWISNQTINHHPVYEWVQDDEGLWIRIADEARSSGQGGFKNSRGNEGALIIYIPFGMAVNEAFDRIKIATPRFITQGQMGTLPLE